MKLFQRDGISGIAFLLVYDLGVDLRRGHVFMRKHFADSVDVSAVGNKECSVSVAQAVKCDFLLDAGIFEPFLERLAGVGAAQSFEYHAATLFTAV